MAGFFNSRSGLLPYRRPITGIRRARGLVSRAQASQRMLAYMANRRNQRKLALRFIRRNRDVGMLINRFVRSKNRGRIY